jgi:hypothetical protein
MNELQEAAGSAAQSYGREGMRLSAKSAAKLICIAVKVVHGKKEAKTETKYSGKVKVSDLVKEGKETASFDAEREDFSKLKRLLNKSGILYGLEKIEDKDGAPAFRVTFKSSDRNAVKNILNDFASELMRSRNKVKVSVLHKLEEKQVTVDKNREREKVKERAREHGARQR